MLNLRGCLQCYSIKMAISERIWNGACSSLNIREVQPELPRWSPAQAGPNSATFLSLRFIFRPNLKQIWKNTSQAGVVCTERASWLFRGLQGVRCWHMVFCFLRRSTSINKMVMTKLKHTTITRKKNKLKPKGCRLHKWTWRTLLLLHLQDWNPYN